MIRPLCASLGLHLLLLGVVCTIPGSPREPEFVMVDLALPGQAVEQSQGRSGAGPAPRRNERRAASLAAAPQAAPLPSPAARREEVKPVREPAPETLPESRVSPSTALLPASAPSGNSGQHAAAVTSSGERGTAAPASNGSGSGPSSGRAVEGVFGAADGPAFIERITPVYPRMAQRLGREGTVLLRLSIDATGSLTAMEIVERAGHGFEEAAAAAVKASRFRPARQGGVPVACRALLPIRFRLEQR
jgi:protein TonB